MNDINDETRDQLEQDMGEAAIDAAQEAAEAKNAAELAAINSSRLRPLMVKVAAAFQSSAASSPRRAFRRLTAPA